MNARSLLSISKHLIIGTWSNWRHLITVHLRSDLDILKPLVKRPRHQFIPYLSGVELHSKSSRVPKGFRASTLMNNSGESNNHWCLDTWSAQEISACKMWNVMRDFKETLCTCPPCMNNTLWDALPIKIGKLLNQMIILQENGTCHGNTFQRHISYRNYSIESNHKKCKIRSTQ